MVFAFELQIASHQAEQAQANGKAQAGAAVLAAALVIHLAKRFEYFFLVALPDANSAVFHAETHLHRSTADLCNGRYQLNIPLLGKFHRVG